MNTTSTDDNNTLSSRISSLEKEIQGYLKQKTRSLKFSPALENNFHQEILQARKQRFTTLALFSVFFYNVFGLCDYLMLPDIYLKAWKLRACVISPLMLAALGCLHLKMFARHIDYIIGFGMTLTSAGVMAIMYMSNHPNVSQYYTGILLIIICGNIIGRLRFVPSLLNSLLILVLYVYTVSKIGFIPMDALGNGGMVLITSILVSLFGTYNMEYEERKDYLLTLLDRINTLKLEESNKQLQQLSVCDGLTGLFNRRYFDRTYEKRWGSAARHNWPLSLIFLDVDFFKRYNDTYGHQEGDRCLEGIGRVIEKCLQRGDDFAARYGGEEFVILLSHTDMENALKTADNIRQRIEKMNLPHSASPHGRITVSLGVSSVVPSSRCDSAMLLKLSDRALYRAKADGRNQVCSELFISEKLSMISTTP